MLRKYWKSLFEENVVKILLEQLHYELDIYITDIIAISLWVLHTIYSYLLYGGECFTGN